MNNNKFHFKKSFSQNFLNDEEKLINIVSFANIDKNDFILEIGPGNGALTKYLSNVCKKLVVIELDNNLIPILQNKFSNSNVTIIHNDFLKMNNDEIESIFVALGLDKNSSIKVVSNIPYNITSPIIQKLLTINIVKEFTLLVQKEVADRILANKDSKDYSVLTISVSLFADCIEGFVVDKNCFYPVPKVDSKVIKIIKNNKSYDKLFLQQFFYVVKTAFSQRRKTLINSLSSNSSFDKNEIINILHKLNINELSRAENLAVNDYINLTNELYTK